jgi:hypothetical protein
MERIENDFLFVSVLQGLATFDIGAGGRIGGGCGGRNGGGCGCYNRRCPGETR